MSATPLLRVREVHRHFRVGHKFAGGAATLRAVDGVSLDIARGETLGLVGESGCGKSTLGRCMLRLDTITSGRIVLDGTEISAKSTSQLRPFRARMQMIFQDPYSSLNPRRTVREILLDPLSLRARSSGRSLTSTQARAGLAELMELVGLSPSYLHRYPHELSGGQRQRIGIARALAMKPDLIVADEAVSALDVSVQAQIVNLLQDLQEKLGIAYVFISHDLSIVRQIAHRTAVMYLGKVVELGPNDSVFFHPRHPYTSALLSAVPSARGTPGKAARILLKGDVPSPFDVPSGCRFQGRCWKARDRCRVEEPVLRDTGNGAESACHYPNE